MKEFGEQILMNSLFDNNSNIYVGFQGLKHILLTIKCLLIVPNPESALNEEAGKLLLERYDDYCTRARIFTEIHAKPKTSDESTSASTDDATTSAKKSCVMSSSSSAADKKSLAKKEKSLKDKKKTLKRLWNFWKTVQSNFRKMITTAETFLFKSFKVFRFFASLETFLYFLFCVRIIFFVQSLSKFKNVQLVACVFNVSKHFMKKWLFGV